jgi:ribosomal-protein-alanine N-acetyltransferase
MVTSYPCTARFVDVYLSLKTNHCTGFMVFSESKLFQAQSARLILRKPLQQDVGALFEIFGDPRTNTFNPAGPYRKRSEANVTMARWLAHWDRNGFGDWAVCLKSAPAEIIGFGGLSYSMFGKSEKINLGYRFSTAVWGQGIASEFAETAVHAGFLILRLEEILATVRENHLASRRVLEKTGLRQIDVIPDPRGIASSIIYEIRRTRLAIEV